MDIQTHGRAAGQSTAEVGIRSSEQPGEYIPAVRTTSKSASSSAKQSTTSEAAGKQPLASNTEVRVNPALTGLTGHVQRIPDCVTKCWYTLHHVKQAKCSNLRFVCTVPLLCSVRIDWICSKVDQCRCVRLYAMHFYQSCVVAPLQSYNSV